MGEDVIELKLRKPHGLAPWLVSRDTQNSLNKAQEDLQTTKDLNKMLQEKESHYIKGKELNEVHQEEVKVLNNQLDEAVRNIDNSNSQLDKLQQELLRKAKELEDTIEKYTDKIQGLKDSHEVALEKLKVTKDMEINQLKVQVQKAKVDDAEETQKREKQLLGDIEELRKEIHHLKVMSAAYPVTAKKSK
jgi:DNA repair exonuclease SbcCD ATPase subunit